MDHREWVFQLRKQIQNLKHSLHLCELALIKAELEIDKETRHKPANKSEATLHSQRSTGSRQHNGDVVTRSEATPFFERSIRSRKHNGTGVTSSAMSQNNYGHTVQLENLFKRLNVQNQPLARHTKNKFKY